MPTTVATPTDVEKAKAALRVELSAVADRVAALATGDDQLAAAINEIRALIAILEANEAADDAAHAALAERVATLEFLITPPSPDPPPPPPPPPDPTPVPPPPPPAGEYTPVARVVASAAGIVAMGVPVKAGVLRAARSGRLFLPGIIGQDFIAAQIDNVAVDRAGWVRWCMLTAIVPASGAYVLAVSGEAGGLGFLADFPDTRVAINGDPDPAGRTLGGWRAGPVCYEQVKERTFASGVCVRLHEAGYANGASSSTVILENGASIPGPVTSAHPSTQTYDCTITRGAESVTYSGIQHQPFTRWVRRFGDQPVFAHLEPLDGGSMWDYFRSTGMVENFTGAWAMFSMAPLDATPPTPFAVTNATGIGHARRVLGAPGADYDIGAHPAYYLAGLRNFSLDGLRLLTWHADKRLEAPYAYRNPETGGFRRMDEGADYTHAVTGSGIAAFNGAKVANQDWGSGSHWGAMFYLPYLVTGRLEYLEGQIIQLLHSWLSAPANNSPTDRSDCGTQLTRHSWHSDHAIDNQGYWDNEIRARAIVPAGKSTSTKGRPQLRTVGWAVRTTVHGLAMMPEDDERLRALTGWDKAHVRTLWSNVQDGVAARYDAATEEGHFAPDGPLFTEGGTSFKHWMFAMLTSSLAVGLDLGQLNGNGERIYRRLAGTSIGCLVSPDVVPDFVLGSTNILGKYLKDHWPRDWRYDHSAISAPARTFADLYRAAAQSAGYPGEGINNHHVRAPFAATCDQSGVVPHDTPIAVTLTPMAGWDAFPATEGRGWYAGTYAALYGTGAGAARIIIDEVVGPNAFRGRVVDTSGNNRTTTIPSAIARVDMPLPHPADAQPFGSYPHSGESDYNGWWWHITALFRDHGLPGAAEAHARIREYYTMQPTLRLNDQHNIEPRNA